jgi:hypothetical protein
LCHITPDDPNRQTYKGLGKKKGIRRKEERYSDNKTKRSPYMKKEHISIDVEDEGSMNCRNNVRFWRMNWIDVTTQCEVQLSIIYYGGSLAEMIRNPATWHWMSTNKYATLEYTRLKEISIVMGNKDQYLAKQCKGSGQYQKPYPKTAFD